MPVQILIPGPRIPLVDDHGRITVPWFSFFSQLLQHLSSEVADLGGLAVDIAMMPDLGGRVSELAEQVQGLQAQVDCVEPGPVADLARRLAEIEAELATLSDTDPFRPRRPLLPSMPQ